MRRSLRGSSTEMRRESKEELLAMACQLVHAVGAVVGLAMAMSGCTEHKSSSSAETLLTDFAKDIAILFEVVDLTIPVPMNPEMLSAGMQICVRFCTCESPSSGLCRDKAFTRLPTSLSQQLSLCALFHYREIRLNAQC
jgi:hypothetical protein